MVLSCSLPLYLQAIVVVGFPCDVGLVEAYVCVQSVQGFFNSRVLQHALSPLLKFWGSIQEAREKKHNCIELKGPLFWC